MLQASRHKYIHAWPKTVQAGCAWQAAVRTHLQMIRIAPAVSESDVCLDGRWYRLAVVHTANLCAEGVALDATLAQQV